MDAEKEERKGREKGPGDRRNKNGADRVLKREYEKGQEAAKRENGKTRIENDPHVPSEHAEPGSG